MKKRAVKNNPKPPILTKPKRVDGKRGPLALREKDFEMYVQWKSVPAILRGRSVEELEALGIHDQIAIELLEIKNQTAFAKKFSIPDLKTLTQWNKKIEDNNLLGVESLRDLMTRLTPNVIMALYRGVMKSGDGPRARVWLEAVKLTNAAPGDGQPPAPVKVEINQRIIQIGEKYEQELKDAIVQSIRSPKRLHPGGAGEGGK